MNRSISRRNSRANRNPNGTAFLNVPYDKGFEDLYLAYIAGLAAHGVTPRAAVEVSGSARRLERILQLIRECQYSFHDLSRVEIDAGPPATPRFNMPFELGLTVGWMSAARKQHVWFVMEAQDRRAEKSLSDLKGTDFYVHDGTPEGVFREIGNALGNVARGVGVADQLRIYKRLKRELPAILRLYGSKSAYEANVFRYLVGASLEFSDNLAPWPRRAGLDV